MGEEVDIECALWKTALVILLTTGTPLVLSLEQQFKQPDPPKV